MSDIIDGSMNSVTILLFWLFRFFIKSETSKKVTRNQQMDYSVIGNQTITVIYVIMRNSVTVTPMKTGQIFFLVRHNSKVAAVEFLITMPYS